MVQQIDQGQLALTLTLPSNAELDNYVVGNNHLAVEQIRLATKARGEFCIYLWGADGVGKSHLLQAACKDATFSGLSSIYIKRDKNFKLKIDDLKGLEKLDLVCIDDIHLFAGDSQWEEALFHLYNEMKAQHKHFIVTAPMAPMSVPVKLPDLRTRLGWGVIYHLHPLTDEDKLVALKSRAAQKGLIMSDDVAKFIISRSVRSMGELLENLESLDRASLLLQRRLTIPFVKQVLNF